MSAKIIDVTQFIISFRDVKVSHIRISYSFVAVIRHIYSNKLFCHVDFMVQMKSQKKCNCNSNFSAGKSENIKKQHRTTEMSIFCYHLQKRAQANTFLEIERKYWTFKKKWYGKYSKVWKGYQPSENRSIGLIFDLNRSFVALEPKHAREF